MTSSSIDSSIIGFYLGGLPGFLFSINKDALSLIVLLSYNILYLSSISSEGFSASNSLRISLLNTIYTLNS